MVDAAVGPHGCHGVGLGSLTAAAHPHRRCVAVVAARGIGCVVFLRERHAREPFAVDGVEGPELMSAIMVFGGQEYGCDDDVCAGARFRRAVNDRADGVFAILRERNLHDGVGAEYPLAPELQRNGGHDGAVGFCARHLNRPRAGAGGGDSHAQQRIGHDDALRFQRDFAACEIAQQRVHLRAALMRDGQVVESAACLKRVGAAPHPEQRIGLRRVGAVEPLGFGFVAAELQRPIGQRGRFRGVKLTHHRR